MNQQLENALKFAALGFKVFPQDRNKRPLIKDWPNQATCDLEQVRAWAKQWPSCNFAVATGKQSDSIVLDIDIKNDQAGKESWQQFEQQIGKIDTLKVRTPSGGAHVYFRRPNIESIRNLPELPGYPGIEVKADKGCVTLPGSIFKDGREYKIIEDKDIANCPPALIDILKTAKRTPAPLSTGGNGEKVAAGGRNAYLTRLAGAMRSKGAEIIAIEAALLEENKTRCDPPLPGEEISGIARSIGRYKPGDPGTILLPYLNAGDKHLPRITAEAWGAITMANKPARMFLHAETPVRLDRHRKDGALIVRDLTESRLRYESARAANWFTYRSRGESAERVPAHPPLIVIRDMLASREFPIPPLNRIVSSPVFAPDDTLQTEHGYNPASDVYLDLSPELHIPQISDNPKKADIKIARDLIVDDLFGDFPLEADSDRAHLTALLLLPFARDLIPGQTPLHDVEASAPGTGKGLAVSCALIPAFGDSIALVAASFDDDEMRKRLTAKLLEARGAIWIDNIKRLDSASLSALLTSSEWSDRRLGKTEVISMPVRAVFVSTGNNPVMSTEIARRAVRIRLVAETDRPWLRTGFKHPDLKQWTRENRGRIIHAALILIQAWIAAGKPKGKARPLGSFEQWSQVMGGILKVAGIPGFLDNISELYDTADAEGAAWRLFVKAWWDKFGSDQVRSSQLYEIASDVDGLSLGKGGEHSQKIVLGKKIATHRDRVFGDFRISQTGSEQRSILWSLHKVSTGELNECFNPGSETNTRYTRGEITHPHSATLTTAKEGGVVI